MSHHGREGIPDSTRATPFRPMGDGEGMGRARSGSFGPAAEMAARAVEAERLASVTAPSPRMTLPTDSTKRKEVPLWEGCIAYFPAALAAVARTSAAGNRKHNPGEELHHARDKSMDHTDCIARHLVDYQDLAAAALRGGPADAAAMQEELGNLCWRVLAYAQQELDTLGAPLAPRARLATNNEGNKK
jgi:hypothetical protein